MVIIKLWEVRTAKGLKLEAVAAVTGVSKSTLNNIENGKTSPTLANLEKIAKGLGCRISDLYESEYK
ncbi:helix-turn-helix domain-containing protein [uncultured Clostridium sp.]|uniref:helix-turn-helix domain-containing protein n=1 Tax=uncultured Clostridium sp. TaxID=59620 RepID=UPI0025CF32D4|nr:helix-turn-helix transcriptional regulator [uncultured Clostridium sp.]